MRRALLGFVMLTGCAHRGGFVVDWSFAHIQDGYDHDARIQVYVDGEMVAQSPVQPQSEPGRLPVTVPEGTHDVRVIALALWQGEWEEHLMANDYAIDCLWEGAVSAGKRLQLVFDLDQGTLSR